MSKKNERETETLGNQKNEKKNKKKHKKRNQNN